jgi:serine/threonine-protein kinase
VLAGKYQVEHVLGAGGIGIVVAAIDLRLERRVALKFLLPEHATMAEARERFGREARAVARLKSEHVARVLDVGTLDDRPNAPPYIVMEYLEGRDLGALLAAQSRLPVELAVGYVLEACKALAEAHALGIVHRDLKPANLFLTRDATGNPIVKVLDFGIAKTTGNLAVDAALTTTRGIMGSPLYMSPEQLSSARDVDARTDVWSLGAILYELVTGRPPLVAETLPQLCTAILHRPIEPPSKHCAELPPELDRVVMRCLAKSAEARFASITELARALVPLAPAGATASIRPPAPSASPASLEDSFDRTLRAEDVPTVAASQETTAQSWGKSRLARRFGEPRRGRWALATSALIVGVVGVVWWVRRAPAPATSVPVAASEPRSASPETEVAPLSSAGPAPAVAPTAELADAGAKPKRSRVPATSKPPPIASKPASPSPVPAPAPAKPDFMQDRE